MEQVNFGYSTKNIPIPGKREYLQQLIGSAEKFIRSIRWRALFFLNPKITQENKETFGFKSTKSAPNIPELKEFEDGIFQIIQKVQFKNANSNFQKQLSKDVKEVKNSNNLTIPADKTTNFYKIEPKQYEKLLEENITKDYKKAAIELETEINTEDSKIATELNLEDRINCTSKNQAFVTLKDHKPNFNNKPTCRLINPTKSEIGKVSKQILERINSNTKKATGLNQWINTTEVINWFKSIKRKEKHTFICFDVCEFYPSITKELVQKALQYAEKFSQITEEQKHIILHSKKTLLYNKNKPWTKRGNSNFDVTMGSFDGAETCELVGLYLLSQLNELDINVGLYRDDGLAVCNKSARQTEMIKKEICKIFKENNLKITIEANHKTVNFLDVTMNLTTGEYKPYIKPNNVPLYVHRESNHPPNIIKNIPENISKRLSAISSNEQVFNKAAKEYQAALEKSGYKDKLKYRPNENNSDHKNAAEKRKRQRNITWFNPPYSKNVGTNIGTKFFKLLDTCFPPENKLHKILNRNTIKISYSCVRNIKQIITNHNKEVVRKNEPKDTEKKECNCRQGKTCPLGGKCLTSGVIYQAIVTRSDKDKQETYTGLTNNTFKSRFTAHISSFKNINRKNATTLSQYIWTMKEKGIEFSIQWKLIARAKAYSPATGRCNLCLKEKYFIIFQPHMASLNNRNELATECRHKKQYLFVNQ